MKKITTIFTGFIICIASFAQEQKTISDCTIIYGVSTSEAKNNNMGSKTILIKGKDMRIDLVSKTFSQTVFYNSNTGNATVLKSVGESKYISQYNADEWKKANEIYEGITVTLTDSTKDILGYNCKQAILALKNGSIYIVYYVPGLIPSVMENPFEPKNIPGLILEYESAIKEGEKIFYKAQKIDFKPVASLQFDIPKTGYRILHD